MRQAGVRLGVFRVHGQSLLKACLGLAYLVVGQREPRHAIGGIDIGGVVGQQLCINGAGVREPVLGPGNPRQAQQRSAFFLCLRERSHFGIGLACTLHVTLLF